MHKDKSCVVRGAPLEELFVGLRGDDAISGALRSAVGAHDRHAGAQLAAERERSLRPKQIIHRAR